MKRKIEFLILVCVYLGLLLATSDDWLAQEEDKEENSATNATVFVEIPSFIVLTLEDGAFLLDLGTSTGGLDLEQREASKLKLNINSSAGWSLLIWTNNSDLGPLDQPNTTTRKPVEDFFWHTSLGTSGQLTHLPREIASSDGAGKVNIIMDYFVDVKESDPPGKFSVTLEYLAAINQP